MSVLKQKEPSATLSRNAPEIKPTAALAPIGSKIANAVIRGKSKIGVAVLMLISKTSDV